MIHSGNFAVSSLENFFTVLNRMPVHLLFSQNKKYSIVENFMEILQF